MIKAFKTRREGSRTAVEKNVGASTFGGRRNDLIAIPSIMAEAEMWEQCEPRGALVSQSFLITVARTGTACSKSSARWRRCSNRGNLARAELLQVAGSAVPQACAGRDITIQLQRVWRTAERTCHAEKEGATISGMRLNEALHVTIRAIYHNNQAAATFSRGANDAEIASASGPNSALNFERVHVACNITLTISDISRQQDGSAQGDEDCAVCQAGSASAILAISAIHDLLS